MSSYELYILRHAKSAWDTDAPSDFQRPLNKRGKKAAKYMAGWLAKNIQSPIQVVTSPALRAWETAVRVSRELKIPEQEIVFLGDLYLASDDEILSILSIFDEDVKNLLLIGHNPGLEDLLEYLMSESVPTFSDGKILPTATLAHLTFEKNWQHLDKGVGKLQKIHRPK